jgi:hypothetical protein
LHNDIVPVPLQEYVLRNDIVPVPLHEAVLDDDVFLDDCVTVPLQDNKIALAPDIEVEVPGEEPLTAPFSNSNVVPAMPYIEPLHTTVPDTVESSANVPSDHQLGSDVTIAVFDDLNAGASGNVVVDQGKVGTRATKEPGGKRTTTRYGREVKKPRKLTM